MNLNITTRHFEGLTDALRGEVEERIFKLEKFFDRIDEVKVILTEEKHRHIVEIAIHLPAGKRLSAREESVDMAAAVELATKKIEAQVK